MHGDGVLLITARQADNSCKKVVTMIPEKHIICYKNRLVNEPLIKSSGFCGKHSAILFKFKDTMVAYILYGRILEKILSKLEANNAKNTVSFFRDFMSERKTPCPACINELSAENRYLEVLTDHFADFKRTLLKTDGLCLKHLIRFLAYIGKTN